MQYYWLDAVASNWDVLHYATNCKEYFLPIVKEKKLGFTLVRNPLLTAYTTIISKHAIDAKIWNIFLELLQQFHLVELNFNQNFNLENMATGIKVINYHTNIINLSEPKSLIYSRFKSTCQRQIKKNENTLSVASNLEANIVHTFIENTFNRQAQKMPYSKTLLNKIINCCKKSACGDVLMAYNTNKEPVGMLWLVWDATTMYYLASGYAAETTGVLNLLVWQALQLAHSKELKYFDFEGSKHKGIDSFFKSFGTQQINYNSIYYSNSKVLKGLMHLKNKL